MKMLTLNTHSLLEEYYEDKLEAFVQFALHNQPDLIALQEVNQSLCAANADDAHGLGLISLPGSAVPLKQDNHALRIVRRLARAGKRCSWTWLPVKTGYGKYDEGLSILSLNGRIAATDVCAVSRTCDYHSWRTRKALGVRLENRREWFYSVHMGWWQDETEPFRDQWELFSRRLDPLRRTSRVWLLGDFNAPAEARMQGYDLIAASGWLDTYLLAERKDGGVTVPGVIDGWRELAGNDSAARGMRIDHIWCSSPAAVSSSRTAFTGDHEPVVSDHFGVLIETTDSL